MTRWENAPRLFNETRLGTANQEIWVFRGTQGTSEINSHCTASLTVSTDTNSGHIKVQVCRTHYGHTTSRVTYKF